ncbi:hypothetical protein [Kocuria sp. SM24M-10]|uniref:hypothetical protein n=1 Tax=Kocuria sp. SM24M-10 TaxID=1660349 RepID=UPI00064B3813|nr:hypothetical protein [Kocuria sp. SM24M-10]KLU10013.1 hypothetical protein ABL57_09135 [Kocuria sp. SM24M-10]
MNQHDHANTVRALATWRAMRIITREASGNFDLSRQALREAMRDRDPDASSAFIAALIDVGSRFCKLAAEGHGVDLRGLDAAFVRDAHQGLQAALEAAGLDADLAALLGEDDDRQPRPPAE